MSNIHVGNPPSDWEGWESRLIHFHDFAALPYEKNKPTWSPVFTCFDNDWKVVLYPGGFGETTGVISLYLQHCSETDISVIFYLSVKDKINETSIGSSNECMTHKFCQADKTCGHEKFATRFAITQSNILDHGTLTVELRFKLDNTGDGDHYQQFIPKNRFVQNMKQLFLDQDSADISFEVGDQIFFAHKLVLQTCAKRSILASLCDDDDDCNDSSPIPISSDVDPQVFRLMLFHIYGGEISSDVWQDRSKEMLEAADKYGLSNLKIEAEGWYVKTLSLRTDNAVEALAYAIDMNCFLLKEVANKFIKEHSKEILSSDSGKMIRGRKTLMSDVLDVLVPTGDDHLSQPHINTLRIELDRQGKEFDGSREMLIARLQEGKDGSPIDVAKDVIRKG
jgi:hypothetical protein